MKYTYSGDENFFKALRQRVFLLTLLVFLGFFVLVVRLWYLQVVQAGSLQELAENNRSRKITISDYRGAIFDRNGREIVSSRGSFDVVLIREDIKDLDEILSRLEKILSIDKVKAMKKIFSTPAFMPFTVAYDVSRDTAAEIEERRYELPGVSLEVRPVRSYKYGPLAAHLIGYLGEISKKEMEHDFFKTYKQGDIIGKSGIEKRFEPLLHGVKGKKIVEVDAAGRILRVINQVNAGAGRDLYLSIDYDTQLAAEKAMEGKRGAVVALKPSTGEVLAMVSAPAFNPNEFARGVERKYWSKLLNDKYHPLNNRALQGQYSPGSIHKIVVAAAALAEGVIDKDTTFFCSGRYKLGRKTYRCWKKKGHGKVALLKAIEQSCDVYFYQVGLKVGVNRIAKMARQFGLNSITGVNLDHERRGLIPTTEWKEKNRHERWIAGETLSISIGQGFNLVTPIQMARVIAAIANGGWVPNPRLMRLEDDADTGRESLGGHKVELSPEHLETIRSGLYRVVNSLHGTGKRSRIKGIKVAGKTGTAQVVRMKEDDEEQDEGEIPEKFRDHAWFVAYAPFEAPEIAIAVVVEHGGHGGSTAAPVAQKVMKAYLDGLKKRGIFPPAQSKSAPNG